MRMTAKRRKKSTSGKIRKPSPKSTTMKQLTKKETMKNSNLMISMISTLSWTHWRPLTLRTAGTRKTILSAEVLVAAVAPLVLMFLWIMSPWVSEEDH